MKFISTLMLITFLACSITAQALDKNYMPDQIRALEKVRLGVKYTVPWSLRGIEDTLISFEWQVSEKGKFKSRVQFYANVCMKVGELLGTSQEINNYTSQLFGTLPYEKISKIWNLIHQMENLYGFCYFIDEKKNDGLRIQNIKTLIKDIRTEWQPALTMIEDELNSLYHSLSLPQE